MVLTAVNGESAKANLRCISKHDAHALVTGAAEESSQGSQQPAIPARQRLPEWSRYEGSAGEVVRGEDAGRRRRRAAQPSPSAGAQPCRHTTAHRFKLSCPFWCASGQYRCISWLQEA